MTTVELSNGKGLDLLTKILLSPLAKLHVFMQ